MHTQVRYLSDLGTRPDLVHLSSSDHVLARLHAAVECIHICYHLSLSLTVLCSLRVTSPISNLTPTWSRRERLIDSTDPT
jgi:hypothetical protein